MKISEAQSWKRDGEPRMKKYLKYDHIYHGHAETLLEKIEPESIAMCIWSPPYHVGKEYESGQTYEEWQKMLHEVIIKHYAILKPGGFLAVNINDILCLRDPTMPRIQAKNTGLQKCAITEDDVKKAQADHPECNRRQLAAILGCSEQTVDRRLHGNNIRGGKHNTQTKVKLTGGIIEKMAADAGLYLYDRRIWVKDPAWANCQWTTNSYRAVDEFEYLYIFWKPGTTIINRSKLSREEWAEWGNRAVWKIRSVTQNKDHETKFPLELPRRAIKLLSEPGETVLDCFMGSGTSVVAAILEDRHYIGIEKEEKYINLAKKNINGLQTSDKNHPRPVLKTRRRW